MKQEDPRLDAVKVLITCLSGRQTSTDALARRLRSYRDERNGRLLEEIVMGVLRRRLALLEVLARYLDLSPKRLSPAILEVLLVSAYQALFLQRIPDHAIVHRGVEVARRVEGEGPTRLVNAVLRALLRDKDKALEFIRGLDIGKRYSLPESILKRVLHYGLPKDLEAFEALPPNTFRVNRKVVKDRDALIEWLRSQGIEAKKTTYSKDGIVVEEGAWALFRRKDIVPGHLLPQDEASQLVVQALDPKPKERVLDLCAGRGIKTTSLLARDAEVISVDQSGSRLRTLLELCDVMGLRRPKVVEADVRSLRERFREFADAILLDGPCTGIGTLIRRPEVRYLRKEEDFEKANRLQVELLDGALDMLRPGGRLLYAVCSFAPEEGILVVEEVLGRRKGFSLHPLPLADNFKGPEGTVLTLPWRDGMDGFFMALIRREG